MLIVILLLYMLLASSFTIGKAALFYASPAFFIGVRMIGAGILLLGYQYFFNYRWWRFDRRDAFLFVQIILFHIYFSFMFEFYALQYVSAAKVCLLYNLSPFITALLSYWFFAERMNIQKWIGLAIGFIGFLPILIEQAPSEDVLGSLAFLSLPEGVLLLSVLSASYGWIVMRRLVNNRNYSPVMVNGIGMFVGGLCALLTAFGGEKKFILEYAPQSTEGFLVNVTHLTKLTDPYSISLLMLIIHAGLLILIANIIFFNLYGFLLRKYSATFLSFAGFSTPLFAGFFDWYFLGESVSRYFFLSIFIIFWGLYLFYQAELKTELK